MSERLLDALTVTCRTLLDDAIATCGGSGAAVFAAGAGDEVKLVVPSNLAGGDIERLTWSVARAAMRRRPSLAPYRATDDSGAPLSDLVVPVLVGDQVIAVLAVVGASSADGQMESLIGKLAPTLLPLGLTADRISILTALDRRGDEVAALRKQLDVFAVDLKSIYAAERDRSRELSAALDELEETYRATVHGLAVAVEAKDEQTGGHLQRVRRYGLAVTALVAPEHADDPQFEYGFLLHDIGKLTVPDVILTKTGPLTEDEWELIRLHPESGRSILEDIPFLAGAREIVHAHHERWDGKGYPRGLAGEEIPLGAKIFPLCDAFDAMTSDRPYRKALPVEEALAEVRRGSGSQFWPDAVEAFLSIEVDALSEIRVKASHIAAR